MRSASSGASEAKSRASTTSIGLGTGCLPHGRRRGGLAFDHDVAEELRLLRLDAALAHELQHRQQGHHHLRALALATAQRGEEQRPRVAQHGQDLGHALEHRRRVRLDLAGSRALLLLDEPLHRALQPVDAQVLERQLLHIRQGGARAPPDARHLRLAGGQPRPLRLHARVLAQAVLELLLEGERLVVELLLVLVGRDQQLRLEVDQRGGHHQVGAGHLEIPELHRLEVRQVLIGDRPQRECREVDLVGAAEVQQQIERPLEGADAQREVGVGGHGRSCTALRTSVIVCSATLRARREPSWRMSLMVSGFSTKAWRRVRIFSSGGIMCFNSTSLQSRHPMPAVRQPDATYSLSAGGVKILCRSNTGQISGLPGSVRRFRAGSVTIGRTFWRMTSGESASSMSLPYDFDIFRPSVPGTFGISVSLASGSGNTGPKAALKRRATSRVSSMCGTWSMPTGTHLALYMRMSADCSSG